MANSNGRELKAENFQVGASSPFFDKFVEDFLEQLCINIIFAEDEKKIQHYQLEEKVKTYKEKQEQRNLRMSAALLAQLTPENLERTLRCSDKIKLRINKDNRSLSEVTLTERIERVAQMPSELLSSGENAERLKSISKRIGALNYLYKPDVGIEQIKGQWFRPRKGKKQGGLVQRDPSTAKSIVDNFGSFFNYLILSYPLVVTRGDKSEVKEAQKRLESHLLQLLEKYLQLTLSRDFGIVPVIDIVYNSFSFIPCLVDEDFLSSAIRTHFSDKYEIVEGYIQTKDGTHGIQNNIESIRVDSFIKKSQVPEVMKAQKTIKTEEVTSIEAELLAEKDKKYLVSETKQDFEFKESKEELDLAIQKTEQMEIEDDGFFLGGGGGDLIPGVDDEPKVSIEAVKERNRSVDVTVASLADEFKRTWAEKNDEDGYFLDSLIEDVKSQKSEDEVHIFQTTLKKELCEYFEICLKAQEKYPLKMRKLCEEIFSTFPSQLEEVVPRNKFFMRKDHFELLIQETIEVKTELSLRTDWERNEFIIRKVDPSGRAMGTVKIEKDAKFTPFSKMKKQLEFVEVREYIPPVKSRDSRKLAEIVACSIEHRFSEPSTRNDPVSIGLHKFDEEPADDSLLAYIHEYIRRSPNANEFKSYEIEAAFWKIMLNHPEDPPMNLSWFLMPFQMNDPEDPEERPRPCSGILWVQYLHNKHEEWSKNEIRNWERDCLLPNQLCLYEIIRKKMKELIKPNRGLRIEDLATEMYHNSEVRDELRPMAEQEDGNFRTVELDKATKTSLVEKTVLIVATQCSESFKFDKNVVYRVTEKRKREASPNGPPSKNVKNVNTILSNLNNFNLKFDDDAANVLIQNYLKKKGKDLKVEAEEERPTINKDLDSFFRAGFRSSMAKQGFFRAIGWTILAEIVFMRTGGPKNPPISLSDLVRLYPGYRASTIRELSQEISGRQSSLIPQWTIGSINQEVFELEKASILDVQYEYIAGEIVKSVQIRMDENKFRRLMNEITSNIERRAKK